MRLLKSELKEQLHNELSILQSKHINNQVKEKLLRQVINNIINKYIPRSFYHDDVKIQY